jgi:collagen type IV alpha-3-binding protein
VKRIS